MDNNLLFRTHRCLDLVNTHNLYYNWYMLVDSIFGGKKPCWGSVTPLFYIAFKGFCLKSVMVGRVEIAENCSKIWGEKNPQVIGMSINRDFREDTKSRNQKIKHSIAREIKNPRSGSYWPSEVARSPSPHCWVVFHGVLSLGPVADPQSTNWEAQASKYKEVTCRILSIMLICNNFLSKMMAHTMKEFSRWFICEV